MRYLLQKEFEEELLVRKSFLYDSLRLWFYETKREGEFITLTCMPTNMYPDFLMILGHNISVKTYLSNHILAESKIVAITCDGNCNFKQFNLQNKDLYIPHQNSSNLVNLLCGSKYNFSFDLTESEIMFYNSPKTWSLDKRIDSSFKKIKKRK